MAKCVRYKRTSAGRRCAKYSGTKSSKRRGGRKGRKCKRFKRTPAGRRCAKY